MEESTRAIGKYNGSFGGFDPFGGFFPYGGGFNPYMGGLDSSWPFRS